MKGSQVLAKYFVCDSPTGEAARYIKCVREAVADRQGCHQLCQEPSIKFRRRLDITTEAISDLIRNSSYHFKMITIAKIIQCQRLAINLRLIK